MIRSPLRYPGGKSKAISQIKDYIPPQFKEYREPFIGGGSLFVYLMQVRSNLVAWINDINPSLYYFWREAKCSLPALIDEIQRVKHNTMDGRALYEYVTNALPQDSSPLERAARFFILNRITFSGTLESGGYSQKAYEERFTETSIDRLKNLERIMRDVRVTNLDYEQVVNAPGEDVFIFLDPPYLSATKSKLYGRNGNLHTSFDHKRFAECLKQCNHKWLITYDDSPEIRENFIFANIYEWQLQYGMNNYKQRTAAKGKELFITNYEVDLVKEQSSEKIQLGLNF